ncbi:MAG TPA: choline-sulfatase [Ramlibacter sp.]|nr:choline-sulfatase [Ramlibacter sp.]
MTSTATPGRAQQRRPHIVLLMADQLAAPAMSLYGGTVMQTPALAQLAAEGVVFDNAYCNFPICAPSRYSMLTGRLPHAIGAFDNASELPSELPTMAHYLAAAGYRTILAGKMHFVGADQLHGYRERLTTDIYPADFLWVPDWSKGPGYKPTGVGMGHVVDAGPCVRNMQIDYDEEVEHAAVQKIYDLAREGSADPVFLTVSFTHPHPPFVAPQDHWDRYDPGRIDAPWVPEIPYERLDPHSQWLYLAHGQDRHAVTPARVRNARHAYYAMASYVDEKIARVLEALQKSGMADDAIVVFCGDHGEMMGERGMWFKQTFYEWSSRVPLVVRWPGRIAPGRRTAPCSLVDLLPTFLDVASQDGAAHVSAVDPLDGHSLLPSLIGGVDDQMNDVICEYSAEGVQAPSRMVRRGDFKYVYTLGLPPMLFDLRADPQELDDLAGRAPWADVQAQLHARLVADWDPEATNARIRASQRRRLFLREIALRDDAFPHWTFEARAGDSDRYVRPASATGAVGPKPRMRFPFVQPTPPDLPGRSAPDSSPPHAPNDKETAP